MLTQEDVADALEINQATYSKYEHEAANLTFATLLKLAKVFNCSIIFLVDIESGIYDEIEWKRQKVKEWKDL